MVMQFRKDWSLPVGEIFLGIAFGVKLTVFPMLVFAISYYVFFKKIYRQWNFLGSILLGTLLAIPRVLTGNFPSSEMPARKFPEHLVDHLFSTVIQMPGWEWDGVYSGGIAHFHYSIPALMIFLAAISLLRPWQITFSLTAALLSGFLLVSMSEIFYTWYLTPAMILIPLSFAWSNNAVANKDWHNFWNYLLTTWVKIITFLCARPGVIILAIIVTTALNFVVTYEYTAEQFLTKLGKFELTHFKSAEKHHLMRLLNSSLSTSQMEYVLIDFSEAPSVLPLPELTRKPIEYIDSKHQAFNYLLEVERNVRRDLANGK